jgi:hypothetical protein
VKQHCCTARPKDGRGALGLPPSWRYKPRLRVRHFSRHHSVNPSSTHKTTQSFLGYLRIAKRRLYGVAMSESLSCSPAEGLKHQCNCWNIKGFPRYSQTWYHILSQLQLFTVGAMSVASTFEKSIWSLSCLSSYQAATTVSPTSHNQHSVSHLPSFTQHSCQRLGGSLTSSYCALSPPLTVP